MRCWTTSPCSARRALATENVPDASQAVPMMADRMRQVTERWRDHGFDVEMTDLWYGGDRNDVVDYLGSHGWNVSAISVSDLFAAQGLSAQTDNDEEDAMFSGLGYVTATPDLRAVRPARRRAIG
jgi:O-methyltransferase involved in polyketide biosynthesis